MHFRRQLKPTAPQPLAVQHFGSVQLDTACAQAIVDGQICRAEIGSWMFYLPELKAKLFHARNGTIDCISPTRPPDDVLQQERLQLGRYTSDEWRRALSTTTAHRLAQLWLVSARLWRAGLGPQPLGICLVDRLYRDNEALGPSHGFRSRNVRRMRPKLRGRLEHLEAAGVRPDKIMNCVRQQVRGYVIDLCSVVGCIPTDAEDPTARIEALLHEHRSNDAIGCELWSALTRE